tara:strand:+ start:37999 stop:38940 length:942 start_codon:yes stop_codon:yes gene_type:complete
MQKTKTYSPLFSPKDFLGLTVLSFGAGQDSTALLYRIIFEISFRSLMLNGNRLMVVFSDTGNEHFETYEHLKEIKKICAVYGVEFHHLTPDLGYHSESWQTLEHQFKKNNSIAMKRVKSCTDNLKIKPIYRWLDHQCSILLGKESRNHFGKKHIIEFAEKYAPIRMIIGFAKGEESRMLKTQKFGVQKWWESIDKIFPLIQDLDWGRADCINYMESTGLAVCGPSNCIFCPNVSKQELIYLWRFQKSNFLRWARLERNKFNANTHKEKNVGALGNQRSLVAELRVALEKHGDMTDQELKDYKFSHGHCISGGY